MKRTYGNTSTEEAKIVTPDLEIAGNPDEWKLICKASSEDDQWMKSTKAMELYNGGVLVQVSTQQGDNVAEALAYIPNAHLNQISGTWKIVTDIEPYFDGIPDIPNAVPKAVPNQLENMAKELMTLLRDKVKREQELSIKREKRRGIRNERSEKMDLLWERMHQYENLSDLTHRRVDIVKLAATEKDESTRAELLIAANYLQKSIKDLVEVISLTEKRSHP